jgi:hypothetical protein
MGYDASCTFQIGNSLFLLRFIHAEPDRVQGDGRSRVLLRVDELPDGAPAEATCRLPTP